ncbi:MAG: hypothetical protein WEB57_08250 [Pseudohongiellaceae bacterium]
MITPGIELRTAAQQLQRSGIETGDRRLRRHLLEIGAIRKTPYGYEVTGPWRGTGLLITQSRKTEICTKTGARIPRHYTVVLVTGDGCSWLRETLQ